MNKTERRALEYVRGFKGAPTSEEFDAMHAPLGPILLPKLVNTGLLRLSDDGRIRLTQAGGHALSSR